MLRNGRCTSLIGDVVAASNSTQTQFRIVGQALRLPNGWEAMRLPYKLFRILRLSSPNYAQRHQRGRGANDGAERERERCPCKMRNGSGFETAKRNHRAEHQ